MSRTFAMALGVLAALAGCAHDGALSRSGFPRDVPQARWASWGAAYRQALGAYRAAESPREQRAALDLLARVADESPSAVARAGAERDLCLAAAAAGDAAVLSHYGCVDGALRELFKKEGD